MKATVAMVMAIAVVIMVRPSGPVSNVSSAAQSRPPVYVTALIVTLLVTSLVFVAAAMARYRHTDSRSWRVWVELVVGLAVLTMITLAAYLLLRPIATVIVLIAAFGAGAVLILWLRTAIHHRRRHVDVVPGTPLPPNPLNLAADSSPSAAGLTALKLSNSARDSVLACYRAVEESLTATTCPAEKADTPTEVIDRAVANRLLAPRPARELVDLFNDARFGKRTITLADRDYASKLLRDLEVVDA